MEVRWFQSLSVKLFALMSVCLVLTAGAVTWQQSSVLQDFLHRQLEDSTVLKSKEVAGGLESLLGHWGGLATIAVSRMAGTTSEDYAGFLGGFVNADPDLEAFLVLSGPESKTNVLKVHEGGVLADKGKAPGKLAAAFERFSVAWTRRLAAAPVGGKLEIADLKNTLDQPLMALALRFRIAGQTSDFWAVLAVKSSRVLATIPKDTTMQGWIVDRKLQPIFHSAADDGAPPPVDVRLRSAIGNAKSDFGFKAYKGEDGADLLGAYTHLPAYGLTVVVTQNGRGAQLAILKTLLHTLLWAWIFMLLAVMLSYVLVSGITGPLKAATAATQRIAAGDFAAHLVVRGKDEVAALSHSVNSMAAQIRQLLDRSVAAARQEKELETARLVQTTLFPRGDITKGPLAITWRCIPASECGGDWWGHFQVDEDHHYVFIADATGHGAAAALVTAIAYSTCRSLAAILQGSDLPTKTPAEILSLLNKTLWETGQGRTSMTFFAASVDLKRGVMTCANAGHNMPYLVPATADDPRLGDVAARRFRHYKLKARGAPLGIEANSEYEMDEIALSGGDRFVFYTDGLFECVNRAQQPWGERSLRRALDAHAEHPGTKLQEALLADAFSFFEGQPIQDDITLVVLALAADWQRSVLPKAG